MALGAQEPKTCQSVKEGTPLLLDAWRSFHTKKNGVRWVWDSAALADVLITIESGGTLPHL